MKLLETLAAAVIIAICAAFIVRAGKGVVETVERVRPHVEQGSEWSHRYHTKRFREGQHRDTPPTFRPQAPTR